MISNLASGVGVPLTAMFLGGGMDRIVVAGLAGTVGNVAKMLVKTHPDTGLAANSCGVYRV